MTVIDYDVIGIGKWAIRVNGKKIGTIDRKLGRRAYYVAQKTEVLPEVFVPAISRQIQPSTMAGVRFFCDTLNRVTV